MNYDFEKIKKALDTPAGRELKRYLSDNLAELKDIENLSDLPDAHAQALETKATKKAYKVLRSIFAGFINIEVEDQPKSEKDNLYSL